MKKLLKNINLIFYYIKNNLENNFKTRINYKNKYFGHVWYCGPITLFKYIFNFKLIFKYF